MKAARLATLCLLLAAPVFLAATAAVTQVAPARPGALTPVAPVVGMAARPFPLQDVRLLDGPFREAMIRDQTYLLDLDPDRLLHNFRVTAGLPSSAQPLGGWEAPEVELRGHTVGHYLSALALMYASTGDTRFKVRGDLMVGELAKVQAAMPSRGFHPGYLSAFPEELIDRVEARQKVWAPYYTLHKILAGLLDQYQLAGNRQALDVLLRQVHWVTFRTDRLTREQQQASLETEHGGMTEVLANVYAVTGNPDHLRLARAFEHQAFLAPLARGEDTLDGLHANTQIPKIIGAAREYELTGERAYRDIASFFWQRVAQHRSYANGGHSDDEMFFPVSQFSQHLGHTSSETCNTYNMLKLTRHLFSWAPSAQLMDFYERGLFNHILASQDPATGMMIYYCPFTPGAFRTYSTPNASFWCCVGTGMENHGKYPDTIYFQGDRSLFVNLFIASEVNWREQGIRVRQETRFPEEDGTRLTVTAAAPTRFAVKLRYPSWATSGMTVTVNGAPQPLVIDGPEKRRATPGSYVVIDREWKSGDTIAVRVPMALRVESMPDNPDVLAVLYGPILLVGDLGKEGLDEGRRYGPIAPQLNRMKRPTVPVMVAESSALLTSLHPVAGAPLTFRTKGIGQPSDVTLLPLFRASDIRYAAYWNRYTAPAWDKRKAEIQALEARHQALGDAALDTLDVSSDESEKGHGLAQANSTQPLFEGRRGREAKAGWFEYQLTVAPDRPVALACTYRGSEGNRRLFDILVDGQKIATENLAYHPTELLDYLYPIPETLTRGKRRITVRFQPHVDAATAAVYEVRTVPGADRH